MPTEIAVRCVGEVERSIMIGSPCASQNDGLIRDTDYAHLIEIIVSINLMY